MKMETGTSLTINFTNTTESPTGIDACRACNIAAAIFVAILMLITLIGNGLVCASFYTFRDLRTLCNYYIISLCVADILVALVAMPFWLMLQLSNLNWMWNLKLRRFWDCMDILCGTASIANLTAVSVDRMLAITKPFKYPDLMTPKRAITAIVIVWVYAIIMGCLRIPQWPGRSYLHFVSTMSFFLPLSIVITMYCVIFLVVRIQVKRIGKNQATEMKAAKTIAVVVGAFLVCWLPFFILVLGFAHNKKFRPPPHLYEVIKWMEYLNSGLNPVIYTCMNRTFRRAFKRLFIRFQDRMDPDYNRRGSTSYWQKGPRGSVVNTTYSTCEAKDDSEPVNV